MGANLALTMAEKGFVIAVFNLVWAATEKLLAGAGPLAKRIIACRTLADPAAAVLGEGSTYTVQPKWGASRIGLGRISP